MKLREAYALLNSLEPPAFLPGETPVPTSDYRTTLYTPDGEPVRSVDSYTQWEQVMEWKGQPGNYRRSEFHGDGHIALSTVYLGLNHSYSAGAPILIYESMIFGFADDNYQWRYSTRAAAMAGHEQIMKALIEITGSEPLDAEMPDLSIGGTAE